MQEIFLKGIHLQKCKSSLSVKGVSTASCKTVIIEQYQDPTPKRKLSPAKDIHNHSYPCTKKKPKARHAVEETNQVVFTKKNFLIEKIIQHRKFAMEKIIRRIKQYVTCIRVKKELLISKIVQHRHEKAIAIQKNFRQFKVYKHVKSLRQLDMIFFYSFHESNLLNFNIQPDSVPSLKLVVKQSSSVSIELGFMFSKYLKCHYLPIKKRGIMKKKFRVNFVVNGHVIIDPRFDVDNDKEGRFYNVIPSSMLYKKIKLNSPRLKTKKVVTYDSAPMNRTNEYEIHQAEVNVKFWEKIFEIKSRQRKGSVDCSSASDATDISIGHLMNNVEPSQIIPSGKPILKKQRRGCRRCNNISDRRVTFSEKVEYSY